MFHVKDPKIFILDLTYLIEFVAHVENANSEKLVFIVTFKILYIKQLSIFN